ncbi:HD domain-containing protein [Clostridium manihotivorum]|uniref:Phosphohydrolase n=1 Tax=Clostridium manihotivorum TaxID=2320868 RepID=A0A410DW39_9CLOT|nr:HD domain-containing protein [Clostridium manihotivorum]QAA33305.1 phosphohydrolase [Clostridium manihotivorum]
MNNYIKNSLIDIAKEKIGSNDPSHDINHALRVLNNAEIICNKEGGDMDIVIPAALFHDIICYQKNSQKSALSSKHSADMAADILKNFKEYNSSKIAMVYEAIEKCSFSKGIIPNFLEGKIVQDADRLEATGAISIMRTFCSAGLMKSSLYNVNDPFCVERVPNGKQYALDLFYSRLLKIKNTMNTETGRILAEERSLVLDQFLDSLRRELGIIDK